MKKRSGSGNWSADTVDSAADADSPSNSPRSTKPPDSIAPFPLKNVNVPQKKQNAARNLRSSARRMRNAARNCDFSVEMQNAAQNLGFPTQKKRNAARNSGSSHGEFQIPCGISDFPDGKCECWGNFVIFDVENAKCNAVLRSSACKVRELCRIRGLSVESAKCGR